METENVQEEKNAIIEPDELKKKKKVKKNLEWYYHNEKKLKVAITIPQMKWIGWGLMILEAFASGLSMFFNMHSITNLDAIPTVLNVIGSLSVSALLIAAFAYVMQNQKNSPKLVVVYGLCAFGIFAAFSMVYFVYIACSYSHLGKISYIEAVQNMDKDLAKIFGKILKFNVFMDLFLYSLFNFFLFYTPKKIKDNKVAMNIFRWMCILPALSVSC